MDLLSVVVTSAFISGIVGNLIIVWFANRFARERQELELAHAKEREALERTFKLELEAMKAEVTRISSELVSPKPPSTNPAPTDPPPPSLEPPNLPTPVK